MKPSEELIVLQKDISEAAAHGSLNASEVIGAIKRIVHFAVAQEQELAALKEEHEADLHEVAEMAIDAGAKWGCEPFHQSSIAADFLPRPIADSVLRVFRGKKAKVGK